MWCLLREPRKNLRCWLKGTKSTSTKSRFHQSGSDTNSVERNNLSDPVWDTVKMRHFQIKSVEPNACLILAWRCFFMKIMNYKYFRFISFPPFDDLIKIKITNEMKFRCSSGPDEQFYKWQKPITNYYFASFISSSSIISPWWALFEKRLFSVGTPVRHVFCPHHCAAL